MTKQTPDGDSDRDRSDLSTPAATIHSTRADELLAPDGLYVVSVETTSIGFRAHVETDTLLTGCPRCGVIPQSHDRRRHIVRDVPGPSGPVELVRHKHIWRCWEPVCPVSTWPDYSEHIRPRSKLTTRVGDWAADRLQYDDAHVQALAHRLGVDWHTCWAAAKPVLEARTKRPERFESVTGLGVDEHVWRHVGPQKPRVLTGMGDISRDGKGLVNARLLDIVAGRSGPVYADWLKAQTPELRAGVEHMTLYALRGYKNAIDDQLGAHGDDPRCLPRRQARYRSRR